MNNKSKFIFFLGVIIIFSILGSYICAQEKPGRDFILYSEYTNIKVEKGQTYDLDVKIINLGSKIEKISLNLIKDEEAKNWDVSLLNSTWKGFEVRKVELLTEEPDYSKTLKFHLVVPEEAISGNYKFILEGISLDQVLKKTLEFSMEVAEKKEVVEEETGNLELATKYPTLENPSGKEFKFNLEAKNNTEDILVCDLGISLPQRWTAYCTPQWRDERISSLKINQNSTENLTLTVVPPLFIEKGEYPITFYVSSGENTASIELKAVVTGTYKLNYRTETGLLNIETIAGEEKTFIIYLWNEGSSAIDNLSFFSTKPEDWGISFKPDKMNSLPSVIETQKPEQIEVTIKTPAQTLPGDYPITLTLAGTQDQKNIELRTTVKVPTKWGWIGVVIIGLILAILIGIFIKLKRR